MNLGVIKGLISNLDEEDARQLLSEIDNEQVATLLMPYLEEELKPHLEDIRERAQEVDPMAIRETYASMSEEAQQAAFEQAVADLATVIRECREDPDTGLGRLKERLRDPTVLEALMLIFEDPDHIDEAYTTDVKAFAAVIVKWFGAQILPEIYTAEELADIEHRFKSS